MELINQQNKNLYSNQIQIYCGLSSLPYWQNILDQIEVYNLNKNKMSIEIKKSDLEKLLNEDKLRYEELAAHYGVSVNAIKGIVREAGLKLKRLTKPKVVLVEDSIQPPSVTNTITESISEVVHAPVVQERIIPSEKEEVQQEIQEPPVINPPIITEAPEPKTSQEEDFIF